MLLIFCKFEFRAFFYWFNTVPFLISRKIQYLIARHDCSGIFKTTPISSARAAVAASGDCWDGGIPRHRASGVRIVEDCGADGFSVIDRCRALRAAVSLGLPPVVAAWIPPRRLDGGHGAWGCDGGNVPSRRAVRPAGHCSFCFSAESAGLGYRNMAWPETAAKGARHHGMRLARPSRRRNRRFP